MTRWRKLKIAVLEPFRSEYMDMPVDLHWYRKTDTSSVEEADNGYHGYKVFKSFFLTIAEKAPELLDRVDLDLFPNVKTGLLYPRGNGYQIVNLSNLYIRSQSGYDTELDVANDMLLIAACGNDGDEEEEEDRYESPTVQRGDHWLAVGATDEFGIPKYYSSYGAGAVDVMGLSGQHGWEGTSFAAPYVTALVAIFYLKFFDAEGRWPTPAEGRLWAIANAVDIWQEGRDLRTGYGLVTLPEVWNLKTLNPKNPRVIMKTDDGRIVNRDINDKEAIERLKDKGFYIYETYNKGELRD